MGAWRPSRHVPAAGVEGVALGGVLKRREGCFVWRLNAWEFGIDGGTQTWTPNLPLHMIGTPQQKTPIFRKPQIGYIVGGYKKLEAPISCDKG